MTKTKRINVSSEIQVVTKVNLEEIAYNLSEEQAFILIKKIDIAQEEWGFTGRIAEVFAKLMREYDKECKEENENHKSFLIFVQELYK